ncbi:unnamed protein product [Dovyalis caffra]|uniref:Uncharacterized protein n=1 Tax=Dovyalis caffra TaxID=77055 RepID=A0AAV1SKY7_9ROSI|nr:unnamed protein product [Dovyalis caffra]
MDHPQIHPDLLGEAQPLIVVYIGAGYSITTSKVYWWVSNIIGALNVPFMSDTEPLPLSHVFILIPLSDSFITVVRTVMFRTRAWELCSPRLTMQQKKEK